MNHVTTLKERDCFVFNAESAAGRKRRDTVGGKRQRRDELEEAFGYKLDVRFLPFLSLPSPHPPVNWPPWQPDRRIDTS